MSGLPFVVALLSLIVAVIALAHTQRLLADARLEFRGQLRDLALRRARRLTGLALVSATTVAILLSYAGWPSSAAPVALAHGDALRIGRVLQLSNELGSASGLGPHLRKEQDVAD